MTMTAFGVERDARTLKALIINSRSEANNAAELLAEKRKPIDDAIAALEKQFSDENFNLLHQLKEATQFASEYETQLRDMVIDHFNKTGEKRIDADCSVRLNTRFQYEAAEAVAWAETNAPVMIFKSVDKKAFESLPQIADLDFVTRIETPSAVIAKTFTEI